MKINKLPPTTEPGWQIWFDGSAKPNPGYCRIACLLKDPSGNSHERIKSIGYGDSSDAEYQSLIAALEFTKEMMRTDLTQAAIMRGDSQVVIQDVLATDQLASVKLAIYRQQAKALLIQLPHLQLKWIPRHKNGEADALLRREISQFSPEKDECKLNQ